MTPVPIEPYKQTLPRIGSKNYDREARSLEKAYSIARHANKMILECPDESQCLLFNEIARRSGATSKEVWDAISTGDGNGFHVRVTAEDRERIKIWLSHHRG